MSETPKLLLQKDGPIGWIIFNQPEKRNAVSLEMWQMMPEYVQDLASDDAIRVVVLRGAGDQALRGRRRHLAVQGAAAQHGRPGGVRPHLARGQDSLGTLTKPLLAMIHGYCVGGGVGIAIGCDMRIASDEARFGIPAARLGLGYHYKGMEKLMKLVGPGLHEGDLLHRAHRLQRAGRAAHGAGEPGRAKGGAGELHAQLRAHDGAQRPAHAQARRRPPSTSS